MIEIGPNLTGVFYTVLSVLFVIMVLVVFYFILKD